jgi:glycosyltransferase involved in cell wall biosynthesis
MRSRPLVSALINNYNYAPFLRDAIDSALNQTYPNMEVIVVDDGSTDESPAIIRSYGSRVVPICKRNGGQASAVNAGVAASRGEIVCLLDADDVWLPSKVADVVDAAIQDPESLLLYHKIQPVSRELRPCGKVVPKGLFRGSIADFIRNSGGLWTSAPSSALSFRKAVLDKIGPIPEDQIRYAADGFLLAIVPLFGPVTGLNKCLTWYRFHGTNQSGMSEAARSVQYQEVVEAVNRRLTELNIDAKLTLEDNLAYQVAKYRASLPGHLRRDQLAWRALLFKAEPWASQRFRHCMKLMLKG